MRDRVVFFILGAVLATVAYFVGDMNPISAQSDTKFFDGNVVIDGSLHVKGGKLIVSHALPGRKHNVVSIESGEDGTVINQFLEMGPGEPLRQKSRLTGWGLSKDVVNLILSTDKRAFIALDDAEGIRTLTSNTID